MQIDSEGQITLRCFDTKGKERFYMRRVSAFILTAALLSALLVGCVRNDTGQGSDLEALASAEVKEYKGKDLSSVTDFRENSIDGPQFIDIETYSLSIDGLVNTPVEYAYDEVLEHTAYRKVVTLHCVEGWSVDILWEGVLLKDLFDEVGVKDSATTVIFYSYDGYSTSLPLDWIVDKNIMIAYKMNDLVLPPERGYPFQLVAESKFGYKWAKWITRIELSDDTDYEGYWESREYSNEADTYPFYNN
jgi:DMSO/TMAO reductase YedYZ molybdopterin-dependent catalytic subunit